MAPAKQSQACALSERRTTSDPIWVVRSATEADIEYISPRLTPGSLAELALIGGNLLNGLPTKGVIVEKRRLIEPVAVFELKPIPGGDGKTASFWFAMTEEVSQSEGMWALNAYIRSTLNHLNGLHPTILTYVDARNLAHIEWLECIGFQRVSTPEEVGYDTIPIQLMKRQRDATR